MRLKMEEVKQGRPWKNDSRYPTYEKADAKRKSILTKEDNRHDVKVKRLSVGEKQFAFFVKTRLKKEFYEQEKPAKKKRKKGD
tara:strand:- start:1136 stop:1384 length:249 start_codon:yes stop_codon:yes gene_type:complete